MHVQVTAEVERMALEICAAETTVELLTKVWKSAFPFLQLALPHFTLGMRNLHLRKQCMCQAKTHVE